MAQAEAKLRDAHRREPDNPRVLNELANRLRGRGELAEATTLCRRALEVREKKHGPKHEDTLISVNNLAILLRAQGEYASAEKLYRRAVAGCTEKLGATHEDTLKSANGLALALSKQKGKRKQERPRGCTAGCWRRRRRRSARTTITRCARSATSTRCSWRRAITPGPCR